MKRRQFIQQSSLGILGFSLPTGVLEAATGPQLNSRSWLNHFADAIGARRRSFLALPAGLGNQIDSYNDALAAKGFEPEGSGLFFCGKDRSSCFYTLVCRHRSSGHAEWLVPFFQKNPEGRWQHNATLNGCQLEALAVAAKGMAGHDIPLSDALIPQGNTFSGGAPALATAGGHVAVQCKVTRDGASTQVRVHYKGSDVFETSFEPGRRLNASPLAPVHG